MDFSLFNFWRDLFSHNRRQTSSHDSAGHRAGTREGVIRPLVQHSRKHGRHYPPRRLHQDISHSPVQFTRPHRSAHEHPRFRSRPHGSAVSHGPSEAQSESANHSSRSAHRETFLNPGDKFNPANGRPPGDSPSPFRPSDGMFGINGEQLQLMAPPPRGSIQNASATGIILRSVSGEPLKLPMWPLGDSLQNARGIGIILCTDTGEHFLLPSRPPADGELMLSKAGTVLHDVSEALNPQEAIGEVVDLPGTSLRGSSQNPPGLAIVLRGVRGEHVELPMWPPCDKLQNTCGIGIVLRSDNGNHFLISIRPPSQDDLYTDDDFESSQEQLALPVRPSMTSRMRSLLGNRYVFGVLALTCVIGLVMAYPAKVAEIRKSVGELRWSPQSLRTGVRNGLDRIILKMK